MREERGRDPAALAIRWVLANDAVASVLIGPKNVSQLECYLKAAASPYDAEDEAFLGSLCTPGHLPCRAATTRAIRCRGGSSGTSERPFLAASSPRPGGARRGGGHAIGRFPAY